MPGTDDRLTISVAGPWLTGLIAGGAAVCAAFALAEGSIRLGAWAVLLAVQVLVYRWTATVLTPERLEARHFRRRRVPWADVKAVRATSSARQVEAALADGSAVVLPGVVWRARRSEGNAPPRSAQAVVEWARARGHDVALAGD